ncbi:MAG: thioredoxin family protein [Flavobacteriales bacterium]
MALIESNPFPTGTLAPDFNLLDTVSGKNLSLTSIKGEKGTVIMFICNHCPFVIHVNEELVRLANDYSNKGVGFVAISSNSVKTHPQDGPDFMTEHAKKMGYPFPYLYDETQEIAVAYDAACTPDFYIFNAELKSVYHGQLDPSRPGNEIPVSGEDMRKSLDNLLAGTSPLENQKPSIGCSIKWG